VTARLAAGAAAASALLPRRGPDAAPDAIGLAVVDALVAAIPPSGEDRPRRPGDALAVDRDPRASVAERLWPRVSPLAATTARLRALDVALVLMAEHELATSTLAVRVAASTGAGPAEVVGAGIATLAGPLHGRAAVRVHRHLLDGTVPDRPTMLDGFGHPVHVSGDPRFEPMVAAARSIASPKRRRAIDAYVARRRGVPAPNCDAALGALVFAAEGEPGASEAVFAVARTAGWVAHAFEEADEPPLRFRGRTLYRGPRP
jgi:citrate synthase